MKSLKEQLIDATQDLKEAYINKTIEWAKKDYELAKKKDKWTINDWCEYLDLTPRVVYRSADNGFAFPEGFYNTRKSREYSRMLNEIQSILRIPIEKYIEKEVKRAEMHYEQSIEKLVLRLIRKGVDESKPFEITSQRIGVNFECMIQFHNTSNEEKYVKAWTIVASGSVQRPHYRYLVK